MTPVRTEASNSRTLYGVPIAKQNSIYGKARPGTSLFRHFHENIRFQAKADATYIEVLGKVFQALGTGPSKIQFRDFSRSPRSRDNLPAGIKFPSGSIAATIFIEYFACRCVYTRVPRPFLQTYVPIYTADHKCQHVYWCLIFSVNSNIRTIKKNIKIQKNDICMLHLCCFYILAILFLPLQRAF